MLAVLARQVDGLLVFAKQQLPHRGLVGFLAVKAVDDDDGRTAAGPLAALARVEDASTADVGKSLRPVVFLREVRIEIDAPAGTGLPLKVTLPQTWTPGPAEPPRKRAAQEPATTTSSTPKTSSGQRRAGLAGSSSSSRRRVGVVFGSGGWTGAAEVFCGPGALPVDFVFWGRDFFFASAADDCDGEPVWAAARWACCRGAAAFAASAPWLRRLLRLKPRCKF